MIRLAEQKDLAGLLALYKELRPNDPSLDPELAEQRWQQLIDDTRTHVVVAEVEGELAATCALSINLSITNGARPFGIIEHVVTGQKFRRQGLSKQVLEYGINQAWQLECYKVMLLSGEQLTGAHKVYEAVGFKSGIEKGFVIKRPKKGG